MIVYRGYEIYYNSLSGLYDAVHDNYDPTPIEPGGMLLGQDHYFEGLSVDDRIKQIDQWHNERQYKHF